jgi:DNA-binding transcriptional ArsR family regulator
MLDVQVIGRDSPVRGGLGDLRRVLLRELRHPASATELAARLGESRQRVNYHVRELEKGGLVELVEERRRRGCTERVLQVTAAAVVVEPEIIGELDGPARDRFAADHLLAVAACTVRDVSRQRARATASGKRLVTFTIETDVAFESPAALRRFVDELTARVGELAAGYDRGGNRGRYRIVIGGHPAPRPEETET